MKLLRGNGSKGYTSYEIGYNRLIEGIIRLDPLSTSKKRAIERSIEYYYNSLVQKKGVEIEST